MTMIIFLFLLLHLSMAFVNTKEKLPASIFTLCTLSFYFINMLIPDDSYYLAAASYDLFIMFILFLLYTAENQRMTKLLCGACFVSILLQLFGWKLYVIGDNGEAYNYLVIAFYSIIILLFLSRIKPHDAARDDDRDRILYSNIRRI